MLRKLIKRFEPPANDVVEIEIQDQECIRASQKLKSGEIFAKVIKKKCRISGVKKGED